MGRPKELRLICKVLKWNYLTKGDEVSNYNMVYDCILLHVILVTINLKSKKVWIQYNYNDKLLKFFVV